MCASTYNYFASTFVILNPILVVSINNFQQKKESHLRKREYLELFLLYWMLYILSSKALKVLSCRRFRSWKGFLSWLVARASSAHSESKGSWRIWPSPSADWSSRLVDVLAPFLTSPAIFVGSADLMELLTVSYWLVGWPPAGGSAGKFLPAARGLIDLAVLSVQRKAQLGTNSCYLLPKK